MTYTHKLARRLAISRGITVLHTLALGLLAAGCSPGKAVEGLDPSDPVLNPIVVSIDLRTARSRMGSDEALPITAKGRLNVGGEVNEPSDWEVLDGGTVTPVGDSSTALFSSSSTGSFRVVGRGKGKKNGQTGSGGSTDTTSTATPVDTVTIVVTPPPSPIVSVSVSPSSSSVVMNTIQVFTASGTREDGTSANPIVTWATTGGGTLNPVESAAEYKAGTTKGTWQVSAMLDGGTASATAQVQVTDAWLVEDFSGYSSTSDMLADPKGLYSLEDINPSRISFDQSIRLSGLPGSMRYDFPDRTAMGGSGTTGRCSDYSIGRNINLPQEVPEVWVEVWIRFSPGFTTVAPSEWGCTSNPDYKSVFLRVNGQAARFGYTMGNAVGKRWIYSPPPSEPDFVISGSATTPTIQTIWSDGQWHRYRYYGSVRDGGRINGWVDNYEFGLKTRTDGLQVTATGIYAIALGRNLNQGPAAPQSVWWGKVTVWRTNPGW